MPFFNLRRLMPPSKVWKLLTRKFIKPNKNKSKAIIKKPIFSSNKTPKKLGWPSLSVKPKKFKKHKLKFNPTSIMQLHKRPLPVYVDQLFTKSVSVDKEQRKSPLAELEDGMKDESCSSSGFKKNGELELKNRQMMGTTCHADEADEMWENLELDSQHDVQEINERAEEFIARFRTQMKNQESSLARRRL